MSSPPTSASRRQYLPQRDGSHIIAGTANIREINKAPALDPPKNGPKTLSGLILENLESFPTATQDSRSGVTAWKFWSWKATWCARYECILRRRCRSQLPPE